MIHHYLTKKVSRDLLGFARSSLTALSCLIFTIPAEGWAQSDTLVVPPVNLRTISPAEYAFGRDLYFGTSFKLLDRSRSLLARPDSAVDAVTRQTQAWVAKLQSVPIEGIQLDAMGRLFVAANQDSMAKRQFAHRLATKGLSLSDRAYTLLLATSVFADARNPQRIPVALKYLAELDALPVAASQWKFLGHGAVAQAYYYLGKTHEVLDHIETAYRHAGTLPYEERFSFAQIIAGGGVFLIYADVASAQPNGTAKIDSLGKAVLAMLTPPADLIAKNRTVAKESQSMLSEFRQHLELARKCGQPAPPLTAAYWFNTTQPSVIQSEAPHLTVKKLNDGTIRLLEFGYFSCGWCKKALPYIDQMRKENPIGVEVLYVTFVEGVWGTTKVSLDEEAKHLKRFYYTRKKYGFSIALWGGQADTLEDGGTQLRRSHNDSTYGVLEYPTFVVVDGRGIIRNVVSGYSKENMELLGRSIQRLRTEQQQLRTANRQ